MNRKRCYVLAGGLVVVAAVVVAVMAFVVFRPRGEIKRCRLLFGPTGGTEVVLEIDGNRLLVCPGSGVEARPRELAFSDDKLADDTIVTIRTAIDIRDADAKTRYTIAEVGRYRETEPTPCDSLIVNVRVEDQEVRYEQYCAVELRDPSEPLAVAHFHGPLAVVPRTAGSKPPESMRLVKGEEPQDIRVVIGTIDADRGCWTVVQVHRGEESHFPEGVFPFAEVEFPPKTPGGQPIVQRFALDEFC